MRGQRQSPTVSVVVVSDNAETIDGLQRYLRDAGVATRVTRVVERTCELVASARGAVILFPDDFPETKVRAMLAALKRLHPSAVQVLVTSDLQRFAGTRDALILAKPAWGSTILDAIRARLDPAE